jgi:hypothetical protein
MDCLLPSFNNLKIVLITSLLTPIAQADLQPGFLVNGRANAAMIAGAPTRWQFTFIDPMTGHPPHHFHEMHDKPMHLVVISQNLKHFAHLHPTLKAHSHVPFEINVNQNSIDPDNFAAPTAVPEAGKYLLYGEIMPMDFPMMLYPFDLVVSGPDTAPDPIVVADPVNQDGTISKFYTLDSKESGPLQANYQLKILSETMEHCGASVPKLNIELSFRQNLSADFLPITDLQPWLSSYGHSFVIGKSGTTAQDHSIVHLHAVWPLIDNDPSEPRGPWLELAAHSHGNTFPEDTYRAWIQIKHHDRVLTLPLTFDWKPQQNQRLSLCY